VLAQGRFIEANTAWIEDQARNSPAGPAWLTTLSWIWARQGRVKDATDTFERLADRQFAALERDTDWLAAIAELVEACSLLGDAERAAILYEQLLEFGGRIVTAARAALAYGPVDYFLGLAALTALKPATARRHLAAALDLGEAGGAAAWADSARQRLAQLG
jgi:tetratricopeptide (TPR) repeat protein